MKEPGNLLKKLTEAVPRRLSAVAMAYRYLLKLTQFPE